MVSGGDVWCSVTARCSDDEHAAGATCRQITESLLSMNNVEIWIYIYIQTVKQTHQNQPSLKVTAHARTSASPVNKTYSLHILPDRRSFKHTSSPFMQTLTFQGVEKRALEFGQYYQINEYH